jgi:TRAP-type mannitol/chloroaromatic compound transport system permease large subunit
VAFIIFMVLGVIVLGIATPTESAAGGVAATMLVSFIYKKFNWIMLKASLKGTLEVAVMAFMIVAATKTFNGVLGFTGAADGLVNTVEGLEIHPLMILISMQLIIAVMSCFMESFSIMMLTLPVFIPITTSLGFDPIWFGVLLLINLEMGQMTPPFGMLLFVMMGVAPKDITFGDVAVSTIPYVIFDIIIMAMIIIWPQIALWLPRAAGY